MALSTPLRRLLRIRELQEEQGRLALEAAMNEVNGVRAALAKAAECDKQGRQIVTDSARTGRLADRIAGLEETRAADRKTHILRGKLETAEQQGAHVRERFLSTRAQRRQAETLVDERDARAESEAERRRQRDLDDWHRAR